MVGRMYSISFAATAETAAFDAFEIQPADDKPVRIHSVYISQTTEFGDAQDEMLSVTFNRGGTAITSGSGGSSATPQPLTSSGESAAGATCEVLNTTQATFTSGVVVHRDAFNVRAGYAYRPTPEERIGVSQANGGLTVSISAPADSTSFIGTLIFEELG